VLFQSSTHPKNASHLPWSPAALRSSAQACA
jgi:hypothetical protein